MGEIINHCIRSLQSFSEITRHSIPLWKITLTTLWFPCFLWEQRKWNGAPDSWKVTICLFRNAATYTFRRVYNENSCAKLFAYLTLLKTNSKKRGELLLLRFLVRENKIRIMSLFHLKIIFWSYLITSISWYNVTEQKLVLPIAMMYSLYFSFEYFSKIGEKVVDYGLRLCRNGIVEQ